MAEAPARPVRTSPHPHGHRLRYHHGWRCAPCSYAHSEYRRRLREEGRGETVEATEAREHALWLIGRGMTRAIAARAWLDAQTVSRLLGAGPRIRRSTEAAVVGVMPPEPEAGACVASGFVPASGTRRQVEELVAAGYTRRAINRHASGEDHPLVLRRRVSARKARAIADLHWRVWSSSGEMRERCGCPVPPEVYARLGPAARVA